MKVDFKFAVAILNLVPRTGIEPVIAGYQPTVIPFNYPGKKRIVYRGRVTSDVDFENWSEYKDSNLGPPGPKPGALPGCATLRKIMAIPRGIEPRYPTRQAGIITTI